MDRARNGGWWRTRGASRSTLSRMAKSMWFWLGFAFLGAALTGWIDLVDPAVQILCLAAGYMAFRLAECQSARTQPR
jgi:hypothetical protein